MVDLSSKISKITLNINDLNIPHRRQRLMEWIEKTGPNHMLVYKIQANKVKGREMYRINTIKQKQEQLYYHQIKQTTQQRKLLETETLHGDKKVNPPRRRSNPQCVCPKQQRCTTYEPKTED